MTPAQRQRLLRIADRLTSLDPEAPRWRELKNRVLCWSGLELGPGSGVGAGFWCLDPTQVSLGRNVAIGVNVRLHNYNRMTIGDWSLISADTSAVNGWHDTGDLAPASGELRIGRGVWIGMAARLVGAITIGDYAIVGAGAVVVKDVAPAEIVVGSPARVIGHRDLADRQWHAYGWWDTATFELLPVGEDLGPVTGAR